MRQRPMFITIILISLVILAGGIAYGYFSSLPSSLARPPARILVTPSSYDFGDVSPQQKVSHTFRVENVGGAPLLIHGVPTSCGCTTAEIADEKLAPGQSADLVVTFDPQAHKGATGSFMRIVYVRSNDLETPEVQVQIHVNVLPESG